MDLLRIFYRGLAVALCIFLFFCISVLFRIVVWGKDARRSGQRQLVHLFTGLCVRCLGIEVELRGLSPWKGSALLVGNHLGFLDVIVLASRLPTLFVTSQEMRETPLLGYLTELGACLYVERRNRQKILEEKNQLAAYLTEGYTVTLFPEGTSTRGGSVLPFKRTLLTAAVDAGRPILPFALYYEDKKSGLPTTALGEAVCWHGEMSFAQGFYNLLKIRSGRAVLHFAPPQYFSTERDRSEIAAHLHALVASRFRPFPLANPAAAG